jgi:hypothetical protein
MSIVPAQIQRIAGRIADGAGRGPKWLRRKKAAHVIQPPIVISNMVRTLLLTGNAQDHAASCLIPLPGNRLCAGASAISQGSRETIHHTVNDPFAPQFLPWWQRRIDI